MRERRVTIPVFYACDEEFARTTAVSLRALIANASPKYDYSVCILHNGISHAAMEEIFKLNGSNICVTFEDVSSYLGGTATIPLHDCKGETECYVPYIASMFPGYERPIYVDSDTIVNWDISELYTSGVCDPHGVLVSCCA